MYFVENVKTAWKNLDNQKVHLKDPVWSNEGPRLVIYLFGVSSCAPIVPWYVF